MAFFCVFLVGLLLQGVCGMLFTANPYNSYDLQASAWLNGHLDIGQNYSHLEIAAYGGKYYISFPPFPSVILLPFVLLFPTAAPDAFVSLLFAAAGAGLAAGIADTYGKNRKSALFWALFVTIGGNFLFVMFSGWVWFMAQTMAFTFLLAAIYAARRGRALACFLFWVFAVGCRPLSAVYLPMLLYLLYTEQKCRLRIWDFLPAFLVGILYLLLNVLRFDNPFEFGHNYLPEFIKDPQFALSYIPQNIRCLLRLPAIQNGRLVFPSFNGFAFYLASPIFLSYAALFLRHGRKKTDVLLLALLLLHLLLLLSHRTMGGWQFGNRYTVDLLPFVFLGCMQLSDDKNDFFRLPLFVLGFVLNVCGTIILLLT